MNHLLAVSVGPVQEFIAAARRTRDLWFGSRLLSEISRAVAITIEGQGGRLVFPAHSGVDNVANVILAELGDCDPRDVAAKGKAAAQTRWEQFAQEARGQVSGVIHSDIWNDQERDAIEFYAAWVPHTDPNDYQQDRARVMRLLAGRKNCRDFKQPGFNDAGLPKSSLDGQRPTVLLGPKPGERRETYRGNWTKKLRLSQGEQLDVIGVVKRIAEGHRPYPSVARVAAETWLWGAREKAPFEELRTACAAVADLNRVAEPNYAYFPYEGTVIFKDRHADLINELGENVREPLGRVAEVLNRLGGIPNPYLAVLVADGDSMGARLSTITRADEHRAFSKKLADFAAAAKAVVERHRGALIYAGGDDVLAVLPLRACLPCARDLRNEFLTRTELTLSVGVAIGHFMENLEDLLAYGRKAEKAAKGVPGKDALAVHLHKRGGAPVEHRAKWDDSPDTRFRRFAELINAKLIPAKLPYELRGMARLYDDWPTDRAEAAISTDLVRLIAKKQSRGTESVKATLGKDVEGMNAAKLLVFADELLLAGHLADALRQAGEVES